MWANNRLFVTRQQQMGIWETDFNKQKRQPKLCAKKKKKIARQTPLVDALRLTMWSDGLLLLLLLCICECAFFLRWALRQAPCEHLFRIRFGLRNDLHAPIASSAFSANMSHVKTNCAHFSSRISSVFLLSANSRHYQHYRHYRHYRSFVRWFCTTNCVFMSVFAAVVWPYALSYRHDNAPSCMHSKYKSNTQHIGIFEQKEIRFVWHLRVQSQCRRIATHDPFFPLNQDQFSDWNRKSYAFMVNDS